MTHPVLTYSLQRLLLLGTCLFPLYLIGLRGPMLLIVALLASGALSLFVLNRQRDAMSIGLASRIERWNRRIDEGAAKEDSD